MGTVEGYLPPGGTERQDEWYNLPAQCTAGSGMPPASQRVEQACTRVNRALHRLALMDRDIHVELSCVAHGIVSLMEQTDEWLTLQRLLSHIRVAIAPFRTLCITESEILDVDTREGLFHSWRLCQERLDALADFGERIRHIGDPFQQDGYVLSGEAWAVDIMALRSQIEGVLGDEQPDPHALQEKAAEIEDVCEQYIHVACQHACECLGFLRHLLASLTAGWRWDTQR